MKIKFLTFVKLKLGPDEGCEAPSVQRLNPNPDHTYRTHRPSSDGEMRAPTAHITSKELRLTDNNKQTASKYRSQVTFISI